ncbi:TPA: tail fiber protein [Vibrio parahaemolyticus]
MAESGSGREQVMLVPPLSSALAELPLIVDLQFGERHTSESLNRKNAGIVRPGVFRGFDCSPAGGLDLLISSTSITPKHGVTYVEFDNYSLTVFQQHDVTVTLAEGEWYVVLEANYKWGELTKQIDERSSIDAGSIKVIAPADIAENQTILCKVTIPAGITELTNDHIDYTERPSGGHDLEGHLNHPDPHPQYLLESELESVGSDIFERQDNAATDADIDAESTETKHVKLPQLWRALTNWLSSLKAEDDPFPQYLHNNEAATNAQAVEGTNAGVWMSALRSMEQLKSRISSALDGTRTDYSASESALSQVNTKAVNAQSTADSATELANAAQATADGKWTAQDATTSRKGIVQLSDVVTSTSAALAATANAVKTAYDKAVAALDAANAAQTTADGKWTAQDASDTQKGIMMLSHKTDGSDKTKSASEYALGLVNSKAQEALDDEKLHWVKVASGEWDLIAKNSTSGTYVDTIETGHAAASRDHWSGRFKVKIRSSGAITSSDAYSCWWSFRGEPRDVTVWSSAAGTNQVVIDVYAYGNSIVDSEGTAGWELWELQSDSTTKIAELEQNREPLLAYNYTTGLFALILSGDEDDIPRGSVLIDDDEAIRIQAEKVTDK